MILHKISVFLTVLLCSSSKSLYPESIMCNVDLTKILKVNLNAYRLARCLMLQNFHALIF